MGNVRLSVDQSGNVVQKDDYYPFGLTFNHYESMPPANQYLFNGKEEQNEWGVLDYEWRNYNAAIGRFNSIDPHADRYLSVSPYNYAFNNPILYVDPDGRDGTLYLQVLTGPNGQVSADAKNGIVDAINRLVKNFKENGIEAKVRLRFSNSIMSKADFENEDNGYHKGDIYTLIGTEKQLQEATKTAKAKGWNDLTGYANSGSDGATKDSFNIINLDGVIDSNGKVRNTSNSEGKQDFSTVGEKLFHLIRHETGHSKLTGRDPDTRYSNGSPDGHHTNNYKFPNNMLNQQIKKGQTYKENQVEILRRLHNVMGPTLPEPLFKKGNFLIQN